MPEKKKKGYKSSKKGCPSPSNDQIGENAGEGRLERQQTKSDKIR